ncbi:MAG: hypothetical protein IKT02_00395, partial [Bacteroidales bacterium]|nr:hypothetical protein [Bacteroidales bacterium]
LSASALPANSNITVKALSGCFHISESISSKALSAAVPFCEGVPVKAEESGEFPHFTITASRSPNTNMCRNRFMPAKLVKNRQTESKIFSFQ